MVTTNRGHEIISRQPTGLSWLPLVSREIVLRSAVIAMIIGTVLTLINQFGWVTGSDSLQVLQFILVFVTPFVVVAVSQVAAVRRATMDVTLDGVPAIAESFASTTLSHGIPVRALIIGLTIGSMSAILTLAVAILYSGDLATVSVAPLVQAYALPLLFGLLSQSIAYRRAVHLVPEKDGAYMRLACATES
jgi:hypothetical protein